MGAGRGVASTYWLAINFSNLESGFAFPLSIPLRERVGEIPTDRPVLVHCAGGYRPAAGASIIEAGLPGVAVYDLGEAVGKFLGESS